MTDVLHATAENVQPQVEFYVYGAITAVQVVAHVPLAVYIGSGGSETQPDTIADLYWDLYLTRDQPERLYSAM